MLGLTAYFDESGHSDDPGCRFVGLGGLCAPRSAWTEFDIKWHAILAEQCDGRPFHMVDFASRSGQFEAWKEAARKKLLGTLIGAIRDSGARPFGAVVSLDAYELVCNAIPGADRILGKPYHLCFQDVTRAAAISVLSYSMEHIEDGEKFETTEQVAMVYAEQIEDGTTSSATNARLENMGISERLWHGIKAANPHFGRWMGSFASASPDDLSFLQAADLFENRINRPVDKMRWGLSTLLPGTWRSFLHKFYDVPQFLGLLIHAGMTVTEDQRQAASINSSMTSILHRDVLFKRMYERRRQNE